MSTKMFLITGTCDSCMSHSSFNTSGSAIFYQYPVFLFKCIKGQYVWISPGLNDCFLFNVSSDGSFIFFQDVAILKNYCN